jgi:hypothetical protein
MIDRNLEHPGGCLRFHVKMTMMTKKMTRSMTVRGVRDGCWMCAVDDARVRVKITQMAMGDFTAGGPIADPEHFFGSTKSLWDFESNRRIAR